MLISYTVNFLSLMQPMVPFSLRTNANILHKMCPVVAFKYNELVGDLRIGIVL